MRKRKYEVNEDYFASKSLESCYYAGMIMADGCVYEYDKLGRSPKIFVTLKRDDKLYLEKIKDAIGGNCLDGGDDSKCPYTTWMTHSRKMADDLNRIYNITPRKSLTLKAPVGLTEEQSLAVIAGYIDGDGCYALKRDRPFLHITGTKEILDWINEVLLDGQQSPSLSKSNNPDGAWQLQIIGDKAIDARAKYIDMDLPFLERKYKLWEKRGANMKKLNLAPKGQATHGTSLYRKGCRCEACKDAHHSYMKTYNKQRYAMKKAGAL